MQTYYRTKKRFGQHFLHDSNILDKISSAISPSRQDKMVEIGPGQGVLSNRLMNHLDALTAIEIDRDLIGQLEIIKHPTGQLNLINADALKFDYTTLCQDDAGLRVVGNLPYNISTPLLFSFIQQADVIKDMHFLLQKEVVDRLVANPQSKDYGRLSIMVQYHCKVEKLFHVPPGAFTPPPKVDSAFVRLIPWRPIPVPTDHLETFAMLVKTSFSQRRKMIRKSLAGLVNPGVFNQADIASDRRPETLSIADFVRLANCLEATNSKG